jgi:cell division protein ZapD
VKKKIIYEQPLNERMRNLMRIEHVFTNTMYYLKGPSPWDSRIVVDCLVEVLDFISRIDFKADLIKDLENHQQRLERWQTMVDVDKERLSLLLAETKSLLEKLSEFNDRIIQDLTHHQLINAVRQRNTIPGGTCCFDLPNYHHWLQRNPKQRQENLNTWLSSLESVKNAVELDLYMIRNNMVTSQETATAGFFQTKLDTEADYQIIQIGLATDSPCYPEISGSKHRFTVRFFEQEDVSERAEQTSQDVSFILSCCMM